VNRSTNSSSADDQTKEVDKKGKGDKKKKGNKKGKNDAATKKGDKKGKGDKTGGKKKGDKKKPGAGKKAQGTPAAPGGTQGTPSPATPDGNNRKRSCKCRFSVSLYIMADFRIRVFSSNGQLCMTSDTVVNLILPSNVPFAKPNSA
jgi:hypothetical protein